MKFIVEQGVKSIRTFNIDIDIFQFLQWLKEHDYHLDNSDLNKAHTTFKEYFREYLESEILDNLTPCDEEIVESEVISYAPYHEE